MKDPGVSIRPPLPMARAERVSAEQEFTDFYSAEFPLVFRAIRSIVGEDAAFDLTQEAFSRAFARWRRLRDKTWRGGWVMTTGMNLARRQHRRRTDVPQGAVAQEAINDPTGGVAELIDVTRVMARLTPRQQDVAVLRYFADLSVHSIAELLGVSEGTIKAHLHRARAR